MPTDNLPPADELFAVRDTIKQLSSRERELKALMIADPEARTGNHYAVEIKDVATTRTDLKEMRAMHPDLVAEYTFVVTDKRVEVRGISDDGEVFNLRRKTS
jgi:hypothetical protein